MKMLNEIFIHFYIVSFLRSASRMLIGSHIPLLSMGMEYMRTNNFDLAFQQFNQAEGVCKTDPLLYNELGVWAFKGHDFNSAVSYLTKALSLCSRKNHKAENETLEVIHVNLAHTYRKIGNYDEAIRHFETASILRPQNASTYAGLGFTSHLKGSLNEAISYYHQALGLKPEDTFAEEMLRKALHEMFEAPLSLPPIIVESAATAAIASSTRLHVDEEDDEMDIE
jgi:anaphase-promoting complex subunit 6